MRTIDLNCDLGEGSGQDERLMPLVSSANIACGGHAGDERSMREAVRLAMKHGVGMGAHPSYPDGTGFGRVELNLEAESIRRSFCEQLSSLRRIVAEQGATLRHVKLHGALYNRGCRDPVVAAVIAQAAGAALLGLPGSALEFAARDAQLPFVGEFFADRSYELDGSLTPRSLGDAIALIHDPDVALRRVLTMIDEGVVFARDGSCVQVRPQTVCVHGDGDTAYEILRHLREGLERAGVAVRAFAV